MSKLAILFVLLTVLTAAKAKSDELPRLSYSTPAEHQDVKAQQLLPYLDKPYVSTTPIDLGDGIAVGKLEMPGVQEAVDQLVAADKNGEFASLDSILLWHDGRLLFEFYNRRGRVDGPHYAMSITKTMTSLVLARAIELRLLKMEDLDKPVIDFMPQIDRTEIQDGVDTITIRDALMMKSGLRFDDKRIVNTLGRKYQRQAYFQQLFEATAPVTSKSKQFKYVGTDPSMVMMIVDILTEGRVQMFIDEQLIKPFGAIHHWSDQECGLPKCGAGSSFTSRSLLKYGIAVLQKGKWNGKQYFSAEYLKAVTDTNKGMDISITSTIETSSAATEKSTSSAVLGLVDNTCRFIQI